MMANLPFKTQQASKRLVFMRSFSKINVILLSLLLQS